MNIRNILLAAASAGLVSLAGVGAASAQPLHGHPAYGRPVHGPIASLHVMDRGDLARILRVHRYRMTGTPEFRRGAYVVRARDFRGRAVMVRVDARNGRVISAWRV